MKRRMSKREQGKLYCLSVSTTPSIAEAEYGKLTQKPREEAERKGPPNGSNILFWLWLLDPGNQPLPASWLLSVNYLSSYISLEVAIHSRRF